MREDGLARITERGAGKHGVPHVPFQAGVDAGRVVQVVIPQGFRHGGRALLIHLLEKDDVRRSESGVTAKLLNGLLHLSTIAKIESDRGDKTVIRWDLR